MNESTNPRRPDQKAPARKKKSKVVPALLKKKAYQEANSRCPFCGNMDVATLEIHHIDEDTSNNVIENLIPVCGSCHNKITAGEISTADVDTKKREVAWKHKLASTTPAPTTQPSVAISASTVNNSIIASNVTFRGRTSPPMAHPVDSIGADTIKKGYIDYLIKRYFDYRKTDASYGNFRPFSHAEIHTTIHSKFKAKTFFIHVSRFAELCNYIKSRVDQTIQGKRNRSQGRSNYDSFERYEAEQLHNTGESPL